MDERTDLATAISNPILRQVYAYWTAKRGARVFPARADIDPLEFRFALGHVSLIDVLRDPLRFRYRLVSTSLTDRLGYEMTGKMASEIPDFGIREYVTSRYTNVLQQNAPVHEKGDALLDGQFWRFEAVYLPLSSDGRSIDMIMACRFADQPRKSQPQPPRNVGSP